MRAPGSFTRAFGRCSVSLNQKRTYASFVNSITLEANQVLAVVRQPEVLSSIKSVKLRTRDTWPQWDGDETVKNVKQHQEACHRDFLSILEALAASAVEKTNLDMSDILELPVDHRINNAPRARTPSRVLTKLGIRSTCEDIGLWKLPDLPTIQVTDDNSRLALTKAREFTKGTDADGGKAAWHAFVAASHNPLYESFDYTADFHSRDLDLPLDQKDGFWSSGRSWLDLSPFGQGYHRMDKDCDKFSVQFADTLQSNIEYFQKQEWRPCMYDQFRAEGKTVISCKLNNEVDREPVAATLKFNVPVWQLQESVRVRCMEWLKVGDDEELVFEGYEVKKRKKIRDGDQ